MATLWQCMAEPSGNPPGLLHAARRTHYACRRRLTPLASDNIYAPAAYAVPFRPYCGAVVTRTRNVSEYMLVLALCLVFHCKHTKPFPSYDQLLKIRGVVWPWLRPLEAAYHAPTTTRRIQSVHQIWSAYLQPLQKQDWAQKWKQNDHTTFTTPPLVAMTNISTKCEFCSFVWSKDRKSDPKFTKWDGSMGNIWLRHTQGPWKWYNSTDHLRLSVSVL